ncbi:MAG: hypothetical protein JXR61_07810 [Prolixibacteraceae bacterium]|nr:hypothetical protein [Prolixibacteraceae bacterium]
MKFGLLLILISIFIFAQKPATDARVILENVSGNQQAGFQLTGEKGKAGFQYLNESNYRVKIVFPKQQGKWIKERPWQSTLTKAAYNPKNKTYYYQGNEGYFAIKFSHVKRIEKEQFKAVFREERNAEEPQITVAEFHSRKSGAGIQMQIKAITAARFKKKTRNGENDITLLSIPGIK